MQANNDQQATKLTNRTIEALTPVGTSDYFVWDSDLPGFGVRVMRSGFKSYVFQYRNKAGRTRRYRIGQHGPWTPTKARKFAEELRVNVGKGADPAQDRKSERATLTIRQLCDDYLTACDKGAILTRAGHGKKSSTLDIDRGRIERHIKPLIGSRKVNDIDTRDIEGFMHDIIAGKTKADIKTKPRGRAIVEGGKGTAARTIGLLGGIFTYAVSRGLRADNPVRGVKRPADNKRQRALTPDEYKTLGDALAKLETKNKTAADAIRLIALTGARRGEILALTWKQVDVSGRCLRLSDTKTGASVRPLGQSALRVLKTIDRQGDNPFVFASATAEGHYVGLPKVFAALCRESKLGGVTLHTLRHSFASTANGLGITVPTIAAMIGHSLGTITGRYIHHLDEALVAAANRVASAIDNMMRGEAAEVVPLASRKGVAGEAAR